MEFCSEERDGRLRIVADRNTLGAGDGRLPVVVDFSDVSGSGADGDAFAVPRFRPA